ncbi:hypothetical protein COY07_04195 [Candidatus Peregrinibacteria bacterium CG_4_10_14_0_2_um_filter_43_11]|nr:MAG: hypothetical protein COY07_04195 [Candidatus Peregrinibacteria bacterium CG_4_10_14_0_2_um_filter_43_11]
MKKSEIIFGTLRVPIDFIAAMTAFMLAYFLRPITDLIPGVQYNFFPEQLPLVADYTRLGLSATLFLVILFAFNKLYSLKITHRFTTEIFKIVFLVSAWLMFIIAYYFLVIHQLFFSRIALAHIWLFTNVFIIAGRFLILLIQSFFLRLGIGKRHLLFVGANLLANEFYQTLKNNPRYSVVGTLASEMASRRLGQLKIVGTLNELEKIVKKYHVEEIIQADPDVKDQISSTLLSFCRSHQVKYHFIPDLVRLQRTNVEIEMFEAIPLISLKQTPLEGWGRVFKRLFDIFLTTFFIVLLIPVWILVPLLVKLDSRGPVFYKSRRKYRDYGFNVYKFRSMVVDADEKKKELMDKNERQGPLFKIKNDPRITRIGRFLRKTSIDELPNLFNVLIGNMSLVGPRPHLAEEIEEYEERHLEVFAIKPGVTGLAQISGRSNLDFEKEVKLDVYYIENWSLLLDIKIILKTIGVMFKGDGH